MRASEEVQWHALAAEELVQVESETLAGGQNRASLGDARRWPRCALGSNSEVPQVGGQPRPRSVSRIELCKFGLLLGVPCGVFRRALVDGLQLIQRQRAWT